MALGGYSETSIDHAISLAIKFLRSSQLKHGEFETVVSHGHDLSIADFDSSPFVTTFVLYALSHLPANETADIRIKAVKFLEEQQSIGGVWRYFSARNYKHRRVPPDLDDTACASFALRQNGKIVRNSWAFSHQRDTRGRFTTWLLPSGSVVLPSAANLIISLNALQAMFYAHAVPKPIATSDLRLLSSDTDPVPSMDVDPVVNANAVLLLGECTLTEPAIALVKDAVRDKTREHFSLYYPDRLSLLYMTARAMLHSAPSLRCLRSTMEEEVAARCQSIDLSNSPQSAGMIACILLTLGGGLDCLEAAIAAILRSQDSDGSWRPDVFYAGPTESWGSRALSVALCLEALARYREMCWAERRETNDSEINENKTGLPEPALLHGLDEALIGPDGVDADWYLARYPEAAGHPSAAAHYAHYGWREGRDPNPNFSTRWYLSAYPDIAAAGMNPLVHYLTSGRWEGRQPHAALSNVVRLNCWWPHKITGPLGIAFAACLTLNVPITGHLPLILFASGAIAICAAFVSIINDLSDRDLDRVCGKRNATFGRSARAIKVSVLCSIVAGLFVCGFIAPDFTAIGFYFASWVCFMLYSLPPVRLKERAHLGVLADALGAHVCPALFTVTLIFHAHGKSVVGPWVLCLGTWTLCFGLRSIIAHQRHDEPYDRLVSLTSYVGVIGRFRSAFVSECVLLPIELSMLTILTLALDQPIVTVAVILFIVAVCVRKPLILVDQDSDAIEIMRHFYGLVLPVVLVCASCFTHVVDVIPLILIVVIVREPLVSVMRRFYASMKRRMFPDHPIA